MRLNQVFIILCCFCFGALVAIWLYALEHQQPKTQIEGSAKALIGGPFNLVDHKGVAKTDKDFKGKYMLIYFGYSFCPDICPTDLQKMANAIDMAKPKSEKVQPIFITIDPERDTVEQMKSYVSNFHEQLVGLTGTEQEVKDTAKAYKIFYNKVSDDPSSTEYVMEHSSIVYLMSPKGEYLAHFSYGTGVDKMAKGIAKFL